MVSIREIPKKTVLKDPDIIFQTDEWKSILWCSRIEILLTVKGLKSATTTGDMKKNLHNTKAVLDALGLKYRIVNPNAELVPIDVSNDLDILKSLSQHITHEERGALFGYPACCTKEYAHPTVEPGVRPRFEREMHELLNKGAEYPINLEYREINLTPCSVECKANLARCKKTQDLLIKYDPAAAARLADYNHRYFKSLKEET